MFIPLIFLLAEYFNLQKKRAIYYLLILAIVFQSTILSFSNIQSFLDHSDFKYTNSQLVLRGIKLDKTQESELANLTMFLSKFPKDTKLICFPYCPLVNVIAERESPSYFSFFYNETFPASAQAEVIDDIKNKSALIVVQDKSRLEPEAKFEDIRLKRLKNYLTYHKKVFETNNFTVYK